MDALLPPDAVHKLKDTLGSVFIGFTLSTALWGIAVLQVWLYYRNYPKDSYILKGLIGALWTIDSASTVFMAHTVYVYTVLNVTNPALDAEIPWSTVAQYAAVLFTTILAQGYYSYQIWQVSKRMILTAIIVLLALMSFGTGFVTVVRLSIAPTIATTSEPIVLIIGSLTQASGALCDILITASLIYFFRAKRNTFKRTGRLLEQLITYAITRGTLTTLCQIFFLILLQKVPYKDAAFYTVFLQLVGKLYVNSVLAALNARNSLRGGNDTSTVSVSLSNITSTRRDGSTVRAPQPVVIGRSYNGPFDHSFGESPVKSDGGDNDYKSDNSDVTRSIAITRTVDAV